MAKTVIGLYQDSGKAQEVVRAVADDGVRREAIRTLTSREGVTADTLTAVGVSEPEARAYGDDVRRGGVLVLVDAPEDRVDRTLALMERYTTADAEVRSGMRDVEGGEVTIPVVEEELQVGTRQVRRGGVRLYTRVIERPVEETVRLRDETVRVERHPADRPASEADVAAVKEGTIEVTETDEEAVVAKRARVVEEVVVHKDVAEQTETVRDTVRRTEVEVEPLGAAAAGEAGGFAVYEADFRRHYTTAAGRGEGQAYERWAPAYRYGYDLASDRGHAGRDWAALEPEARRDWEAQQKGTWEECKDTIHFAWERVRGRR